MFGSHLIDNIKNKQYTNLKVAVLLQPMKRETKILYNSGIGEKARISVKEYQFANGRMKSSQIKYQERKPATGTAFSIQKTQPKGFMRPYGRLQRMRRKRNIHKVWFAKYALTKDLYEKEVVKTSEDGIPSMGRHGMMLSMAKVKTVDIIKKYESVVRECHEKYNVEQSVLTARVKYDHGTTERGK